MSQYIEKAQTWSIEQLNNANNLLTFNASMNRKIDLIQKSFGIPSHAFLFLSKPYFFRLALIL